MNPYRARTELGRRPVEYYHHLHPSLQMRLWSWIIIFIGVGIAAFITEMIKIA